MKIGFQTPPKHLDEKMLYNVLRDYKILNCEVLVRDENGESSTKPTTDQLTNILVQPQLMTLSMSL
jgi:ribosome-interacting GTPase 1